MSKVIIFSRMFPVYHPKKGQPTFFVEKFWKSLGVEQIKNGALYSNIVELNQNLTPTQSNKFWDELKYGTEHPILEPKYHTIRARSRFKIGDYFSPRVWSGKPYNSKQVIIAPDIKIKKVWSFEMDLNCVYSINGKYTSEQTDYDLALNDGLTESEMQFWFMPNMDRPKEFKGQIICWNENINY